MMATPGSGLAVRVATALILVGLFLSLIWIEAVRIGLVVLVTVLAGVGIREFYGLVQAKGFEVQTNIGVIVGMIIAGSAAFGRLELINVTLVGGIVVVLFFRLIRPGATMGALLGSAGGLVYVGWTAAHVNLMHCIEGNGTGLVTLLIVAVALTDVGAYFVGKALGKHKLAPVVSPNKTWEGSIGGFVFTGIGMVVLWKLREAQGWESYPDWSVSKYFAVGAVLSIASQIGDLTESAFKRDAGVKDSGALLPGHGGVLDRCDGLLFAGPVLYYLVVL